MMKDKKTILSDIAKQFAAALFNDSWLKGHIGVMMSTYRMQYDIVINNGKKNIAFIEYITKLNDNVVRNVFSILYQKSKIINTRYIILTDAKKYFIFDSWNSTSIDDQINILNFNQVINILRNPIIKSINTNDYISDVRKLLKKYKLSPGMRDGSLVYDPINNTIFFTPKIEFNLFERIVLTSELKTIKRFTSIENIFSTIINNSFRMIALEGMNDKEDGDFLGTRLYDRGFLIDEYMDKNETAFIMSCSSTHERDLNMWRLYANDTKGVCIELEQIQSLEDMKKYGFVLAPVIYDDNPYFQCLKELVDYFKSKSITFVFKQWNMWRSFFKSKDYKIEQEVRLLYLRSLDTNYQESVENEKIKKGWLLTKDCHVVSEYLDFKDERLASFPLKISKLILGSNCREKETNRKQFIKMLSEISSEQNTIYDKKKVPSVEVSLLFNYRSS